MKTLVVDASVLIKQLVPEEGSAEALALRKDHRLVAPELVVAECANILWKKVRRRELTGEEAELAAALLERADVELFSMRGMIRSATEIAVRIAHPAYDCMYLALALAHGWTFVTADESLVRKVRRQPDQSPASVVATMAEATVAGS